MLYICLYIISSSSYIATLASITVYSYKTIIRPVNGHGLSNKSFTGITFTSIKPFTRSFTRAASYNNILLIYTLLVRLYRSTSYGYTSKISAQMCIRVLRTLLFIKT